MITELNRTQEGQTLSQFTLNILLYDCYNTTVTVSTSVSIKCNCTYVQLETTRKL